MREAIENCVWMEVALRRLYFLVYLENRVQGSGGLIYRKAVQIAAQRILEILPGGLATCSNSQRNHAEEYVVSHKGKPISSRIIQEAAGEGQKRNPTEEVTELGDDFTTFNVHEDIARTSHH
ncbi:hypothetical protein BWQ96_09939 [Gracilariopsis chorda]|uniref:Uncharacterized protein n=1 Tax=Gracilariopsis chorda TaxID=448386 RepID=A0A2V3IE82_9FLOR|nr:hypothetical protein BWQ96_09939 [Gracilariopsis chorda]|eukprot:PXF40361.1 hypothetical protein BWQ96_09939 [Gracilariopsis chorda]